MDRGCRRWLCALGLLTASACGENATNQDTTCPPLCSAPGPAQINDGGASVGSGSPEASAPPPTDAGALHDALVSDAGAAPSSSRDASAGPTDAGLGATDANVADASADASSAIDGSVADGSMGTSSAQMLPPINDYSKPGPFKTTTQANVGPSNNYTIFRPDPLGADGFKHSPIIFGPGILTTASLYSSLLTHLASHGFVTICVNSMSGGPGAPGNLQAMKTGLDWLLAQNDQAGIYQGKLAVERAVTMGYSIGATASVELSSHKAIMTSVVIHGHNTKGDPHGPVLMITGTSDVIDDMRKTLSTLEEAPAVLVALPIGHLDVLTELAMLADISPQTRYIAPITAWLRYWVNGDQQAKRFFWGDNCEMCKSPWITPEPNAKWKAQML